MQMHVTTGRCANSRRSRWLPVISAHPHRSANARMCKLACLGHSIKCATACEGIPHTRTRHNTSAQKLPTHTLSRTHHPSPAFHLARREHARALWAHTMLQADAPGHCDAHDTSHDVCFVCFVGPRGRVVRGHSACSPTRAACCLSYQSRYQS